MILVTGATGFIGSYLLMALCQNNYKVKATYRNKQAINNSLLVFKKYNAEELFEKINWVEADLLYYHNVEPLLENVSVICNCAANVTFSLSKRKSTIHNNLSITANLVNAALKYSNIIFCQISSISALSSKNELFITEKHQGMSTYELSKAYPYAQSKYLAEMEVRRAFAEGLKGWILSPSVVLGWNPSKKDILHSIISLAKKRLLFAPKGRISFIEVTELSNIIIKLLNTKPNNELYICSNYDLTYYDFFNQINASLNYNNKIKSISNKTLFTLGLIAGLIPIIKNSFNLKTAKMLSNSTVYSGKKIQTYLNLSPFALTNENAMCKVSRTKDFSDKPNEKVEIIEQIPINKIVALYNDKLYDK